MKKIEHWFGRTFGWFFRPNGSFFAHDDDEPNLDESVCLSVCLPAWVHARCSSMSVQVYIPVPCTDCPHHTWYTTYARYLVRPASGRWQDPHEATFFVFYNSDRGIECHTRLDRRRLGSFASYHVFEDNHHVKCDTFEDCAHKLARIGIPEGHGMEIVNMRSHGSTSY